MNRTQDYIVDSLEQHLFFARIMKEHAFFLKVGMLPPDAKMAAEAEQIMRRLEAVLSRAITLSNHVVRNSVLDSGEVLTEFTDRAERQTQKLTGTFINRKLTARTKMLKGRGCGVELRFSESLMRQVHQLNRDALGQVNRLISFKERLLRSVNSCEVFTANYPLLIEHILREARLYRAHLMRLEGMDERDCREMRNGELFWNRIMMEHAMFIRGLLDPNENDLIDTADDFANDYRRLISASAAANDKMLQSGGALALTRKFRDFKQAGVEGIEGCQIRSIILPLLADHVLREANHYIRLLEE